MASKILMTGLIAVLAAACGPQAKPVDVEAERNAILAADDAWSQTPTDVDAYLGLFAHDGIALAPGSPTARGAAAIREVTAPDFEAPGAAVEWTASEAGVSACGDLGYSVGTFQQAMNDANGNPVETSGKYVTVWKKQADGSWKVAVDAFNNDAELAASAADDVSAGGADPLEVDPDHYSLEFENEKVRVLRIRYGPGEKSVMHSHPDGVAVFLTNQEGRFALADGTEREETDEAGTTEWAAAEEHIPENTGDEGFELILVELKPGG